MFKSKIFWDVIVGIVLWIITFSLISWLVEGSFWLHFFLTGGITSYHIQSTINDVKKEISNLDLKTNIIDMELIRISPMVDEHDEKIDELNRKIYELEDRIDSSYK